jgi:hypothetical protein
MNEQRGTRTGFANPNRERGWRGTLTVNRIVGTFLGEGNNISPPSER